MKDVNWLTKLIQTADYSCHISAKFWLVKILTFEEDTWLKRKHEEGRKRLFPPRLKKKSGLLESLYITFTTNFPSSNPVNISETILIHSASGIIGSYSPAISISWIKYNQIMPSHNHNAMLTSYQQTVGDHRPLRQLSLPCPLNCTTLIIHWFKIILSNDFFTKHPVIYLTVSKRYVGSISQ